VGHAGIAAVRIGSAVPSRWKCDDAVEHPSRAAGTGKPQPMGVNREVWSIRVKPRVRPSRVKHKIQCKSIRVEQRAKANADKTECGAVAESVVG